MRETAKSLNYVFFFAADEPGKPGTPEITDYDRDFVDLKWRPPESDGGSPIKEYIVQRRDKLK